MTFLEALDKSILTNEIGICPIQLVQYDSATLHLSAQDISAHRFLKNQKRIYQELKPQKREILQSQQAVLTPTQLLTFDAFQQQTSSFNILSKSCQVTCYDLVSSYTESSPFKYALVFSKRIKRTTSLKRNSNSHLSPPTGYFHHTVKSLPYRIPWLKYPVSNVESVVILFNQKRKRKIWRQCLKKCFGIKVLNLNKAIYRNSVEQHYQQSSQSDQGLDDDLDPEYHYTHQVQPLNIIKTQPCSISPSSSYNSSLTTPPSLSTSPTSYYSSPPTSPKPSFKLSPKFSKFSLKHPPNTIKPCLKFDDSLIENDLFNQELFQLTTKFNKHNNIIDDFNDLLMTSPTEGSPTLTINYNHFIPPPHSPPKFKLPKIPE